MEVYDLLTYLGDLGGLFDIAFFIGKLLTMSITAKFFNAALISQAYRIQQPLSKYFNQERISLAAAKNKAREQPSESFLEHQRLS